MRIVANGETVNVGGSDGFSPTVEVSEIPDGHRVEITDAEGAKSFDVIDGVNGVDGTDGRDGANGIGVPSGGSTGQILAKSSDADYDTAWVDAPQAGGDTNPDYDDIYSTTETRIGRWIDGRPLYRVVVQGTVANPQNMNTTIYRNTAIGYISQCRGFIGTGTYRCPTGYTNGDTEFVIMYVINSTGVQLYGKLSSQYAANSPFIAIIEYTKAADKPEVV